MARKLVIAIEGCCHGELDNIYKQLLDRQKRINKKIDLLLICGDFQAIRNVTDLTCMSCPDKYKQIGGFHRYYTGQRVAPVPTIFVGGNHEAGNHLRELYYGGWVAPNIYYMGNSGVIRFGGLRIGGISGIFKDFDYAKGYYERPPFRGHSRASLHHTRAYEVFKMLQIRKPLDIVVSHDWPQYIERHGDTNELLRKKPFFKAEVERGDLGSPVNSMLLERLRPAWWFSAHLHVPIATDPHIPGRSTNFLALDKCLPRRQFLEIVEVETTEDVSNKQLQIEYDPEWLAILRLCNEYMPLDESPFCPPATAVMSTTTPQIPLFSDESLNCELSWVSENVFSTGKVAVPHNFAPIAPAPPPETPDHVSFGLASGTRGGRGRGGGRGHDRGRGGGGGGRGRGQHHQQRVDAPWPGPRPDVIYPNTQTEIFCKMIGILDHLTQRRH
ncbi:hypothetical protein COEREDRAFT_45731 [Coemansia reversa NRRL 1564]|uniref:Lariat debranching enzyme C-terminal domain-containing protein n=1 Tax=Coemansia reversa (strain ATCC 12441 / NRRL 1564) TaxID=763665 RepID=A0A2G5B7L0_COERN|nr:hypothetical protein COEREDRAFT_45731 [Coemansia reversa NRRL 1564]|eukprot:PIA14995.1 hypothetical protein COEREDRAFT_45731 [Coemansia reversa NRRL 1564]